MTIAPRTRLSAPTTMAYARIEVPDVDASVAWYGYHVGLEVSRGAGDSVYLRNGLPHHAIELVPAPHRSESWTTGIGFTVADAATLAELRARCVAAGAVVQPLADTAKPYCRDGFGVVDPNGLVIELVLEYEEYAYVPVVELRPLDLVHPFVSTDRYEATVAFYTEVLGFLVSDRIGGSTTFLRSEDRYHHSFAIRRDDRFYVAHLCFLVENFDHLMRRRARAIYKGVPIPSDLVNHSASGSIAFYMHDPAHGPRIELCDGHTIFDEAKHETHHPRTMTVDPRNIDIWRAAADDWGRF